MVVEFKLVPLDSHVSRSSLLLVEQIYRKFVKVRQSAHLLNPRLYISDLLLSVALLGTSGSGKIPGSNIRCNSVVLVAGTQVARAE